MLTAWQYNNDCVFLLAFASRLSPFMLDRELATLGQSWSISIRFRILRLHALDSKEFSATASS